MSRQFVILALVLCVSFQTQADDRWLGLETLDERIEQGSYGTVTSVLVMERGSVIYEGYFNGAKETSLHNTRSVTKTITGMAVGAAIDDGFMSVTDSAVTYFADEAPFDHPDPRKEAVSVQDLINMSGILECNDDDRFSRGNEARMHNVEDWVSFYWDLPIRGYPSWVPKPETAKYGRVFFYCSAAVEIAGMVVERASNQSFQKYVAAKFFEPMGITQYEWQENGLGQAHKSGGLALTTRGLAKFAEMQRSKGVYNNRRILSQAWTQESIKPRVVADADRNYGYLWWLASYDVGQSTYASYYMGGNGGNRVVVMPSHDLVVVVTKTDFGTQGMHQKTDLLFTEEIFNRLGKSLESQSQ